MEEGCLQNAIFNNIDVENTIVANTLSVDTFGSISSTGNASIDGDLTVDTNTLFVDSINNRVGIGTTTIDNLFEVFGSSSPQCKFSYDADSFCTIAVADGSNTTFATGESGTFTFSDATTFSSDITIGGNIIADANEAKSIFTDVTSNNITIGGSGSTVIVDNLIVNDVITSTNTRISDQLIELGNGRTGAPSGDAGIVIERGDENNAFIGFDESADVFIMGTGTFTGVSTGDLTITPGTLNIAGLQLSGTSLDATVAELNLMDAATSATSTTLVDADRIVVNDDNVGMVQVALTDFNTYFASALDTLNNITSASSLVTVGVLNSGSITSGFGTIDIGSSALTAGTCTVTSVVLADSQTITFGTGSDVTMQYNGTDLVIDNTAVTGDTTIQLGTDTSATKFDVKNNSVTELFSIDGAGTLSLAGTALTATITEINTCCDGDTGSSSITLATTDAIIINDAGTMKQVALSEFETFMESNLDTLNSVTSASSLVTVGALASGSIASGFGTIATGNNITTTAKLGVGTASIDTSAALEIDSTTGALLLPRMTTAQRDALTAVNGMMIFNTTDTQTELYLSGEWGTGSSISSSFTTKLSVDVGASTYTPSTSDGILVHMEGGVTYTDNSTAGSGTATAALLNSFETGTLDATNASVTTTDAATVYISGAPAATGNMTITNAWALWVDAGDVRMDGKLGIGTGSIDTSAALEIDSTTGALLISRMTTTQRDALTAVNGMMIYNSTTKQMEKYEGSGSWSALHIHNGTTLDSIKYMYAELTSNTAASASEFDIFDFDNSGATNVEYQNQIFFDQENGRFTVTTAGDYLIQVNLLINDTTTESVTIDFNVNDVTQFAYDALYDTYDDPPFEITGAIILTLAANDYVNITIDGSSGTITAYAKSSITMALLQGNVDAENDPSVMSLYRTADSTTTTAEFDAFATASVTTLTSRDITHNTSNGRFTVTNADYYFIHVTFRFDITSDNTITVDFNVNDSTVYTAPLFVDLDAEMQEMTLSCIQSLSANDYINITCDGTTTAEIDTDSHIMITSLHALGGTPDHISLHTTANSTITGDAIGNLFATTSVTNLTSNNITHDTLSGYFTVTNGGIYYVQVNVLIDFAATSPSIVMDVRVNGIVKYTQTWPIQTNVLGNQEQTLTCLLSLAANDSIEITGTPSVDDDATIESKTIINIFRLSVGTSATASGDMTSPANSGELVTNEGTGLGRLRTAPKITYDHTNHYLGINKASPSGPFHIKQQTEDASGDIASLADTAIIIEQYDSNNEWAIGINGNDDLSFYYNLAERGYIQDGGAVANIDFTGQHRNILNKHPNIIYNYNNLNDIQGLIVSSANKLVNLNNTYEPQINESLPIVNITIFEKDPAVFGVISGIEDNNKNTRNYSQGAFATVFEKSHDNENRLYINSLGEGGIWVCNINGSFERGDFIVSSNIPGYGMKQDDDLQYNYTVAKITCDCDFNLKKQTKKTIKTIKNITKKREYIKNDNNTNNIFEEMLVYDKSGKPLRIIDKHPKMKLVDKVKLDIDYDENGNVIFIDEFDEHGNPIYEYAYNTRFILENGEIIYSEKEYKNMLNIGIPVYIACFVGCTYHCG